MLCQLSRTRQRILFRDIALGAARGMTWHGSCRIAPGRQRKLVLNCVHRDRLPPPRTDPVDRSATHVSVRSALPKSLTNERERLNPNEQVEKGISTP